MKIIWGSKNEKIFVDDEDYNELNKSKWYLHPNGYAIRDKSPRRMHRLILGLSKGLKQIDHINGKKLDNRKENLRICSSAENSWNRRKVTNKYKFKGVGCQTYKDKKYYTAFICKNYKLTYLGCFTTPEMAAKKYDVMAEKLFGKYAVTNKMLGLV